MVSVTASDSGVFFSVSVILKGPERRQRLPSLLLLDDGNPFTLYINFYVCIRFIKYM